MASVESVTMRNRFLRIKMRTTTTHTRPFSNHLAAMYSMARSRKLKVCVLASTFRMKYRGVRVRLDKICPAPILWRVKRVNGQLKSQETGTTQGGDAGRYQLLEALYPPGRASATLARVARRNATLNRCICSLRRNSMSSSGIVRSARRRYIQK
jgi:hypothetical protein